MKEIKFRIYDKEDRKYVEEPDFRWLLSRNSKLYNSETDEWHNVGERYIVEFFTGLTDKNGIEIYEGDVVKYYTIRNYVQQSFTECSPEIDDWYIHSINDVVVFDKGVFNIGKVEEYNHTIENTGLYELDWIIEQCCVEQNDDGTWSDCNSNYIDESILGIEVIGNIHDNKELLTNK